MVTKCENCPLRGKDLFNEMTDDHVRFVKKFKSGELKIDAGSTILMEGSNSPQLFTALRGMGVRYKTLPDGNRQVINFVFPGDFLGLQAAVMGVMGHSIEATTNMTLCVFDRTEFWEFFKTYPDRAFDLTWLAAVEEHFLGEAILTTGQRSALQAVAWALGKIYSRGVSLGLVQDGSVPFPFKQQDLADAVGLSLVHTNKTIKKLRDRQLISLSNGRLSVADLQKLADVADMPEIEPSRRPLM